MTHAEFQPNKLHEGDWLCIAYHSKMIICVLQVFEKKIQVSGMPSPLMYGEYWPIELTQDIINKANIGQIIQQMENDGKEHKYVHQVQHYLKDTNNPIEIKREFLS